ncbi:hypothetical protein I3842_11G010000 [Carya illinoinensis]|uniref:4-coumarate--CoA ligase n=2 Tax=Carya illinoinensis TaxID=32201 RepID=A0A922DKR6_CARIL|nr:hypothetical protein I3842_11G010000 [Carya illinoinensis]
MADVQTNPRTPVDPNSGFCHKTKTFQSLRPRVPLPPLSQPLSIADFILSELLLRSPASNSTTTFLVEFSTGVHVSYSLFLSQIHSLATSLRSSTSLSKGHVAFILVPPSLHVPVLYFALLALGVTISSSNPLGSASEISYQVRLCNPVIAFATSSTSHKLPSLPLGTILLDSPEFLSMINGSHNGTDRVQQVQVSQSNSAAILYSSGTTGRVKGALLTHRNLIAQLAKVNFIPVTPSFVVALAKSDLVNKYDLSSLQLLGSSGAPLGKEVTERFADKFPNVTIMQGYGLTESGGGGAVMVTPEESRRHGSVGRLSENMEAKIVDPVTGEALPPGQKGELWLRGPTVMNGYVGDDKATAETLDSEGWLKTGDLCYFDSEGFLYIVDRLKELIKYKAYQVPPAELEHLLLSHPEIADAAVIPYPDEEAGQIPMAFVVRNPGSNIGEAQVIGFMAKQVAPYKKVRRVSFINSIPKSPAGKILRRELVTRALSLGSSRL